MDCNAPPAAPVRKLPGWLERARLIGLQVALLNLALLLAGLYLGLARPGAAAAEGSLQVAPSAAPLNAVFIQASSNDPPGGIDPGQDLDVGECRVNLDEAHQVSVTLSNVYPGYACLLQVTVKNASNQPMQLVSTSINASPGLQVSRISEPGRDPIPKNRTVQREYRIRILQEAAQMARLTFQISEVYEQVTGGPK
jgi:hypothetical protein